MNTKEYYEKEADYNGYIFFARYELPKDRTLASIAHFHDSIELLFVREGCCEAHVSGQSKSLTAGGISFADSLAPHFYGETGDAVVYVAVIDKKLFTGDALSTRIFAPFPEISAENFGVIMRFFDCVEPLLFPSGQILPEIKRGFADMLLGMMYRFCQTSEKTENKTALVMVETLKYINEHFRENVTLSFLASKFSYTENYFSSLFNNFTGTSLREYLNRRRIGEVLRLKAKDVERSLFSIALECGYTNEKTFYRALAKYKGE